MQIIEDLTPPEQELFAYLGAFATKPSTFDLEALQSVWSVSPEEAQKLAQKLIEMGIIEQLEGGRLAIDPVIAKLAKSLWTEE